MSARRKSAAEIVAKARIVAPHQLACCEVDLEDLTDFLEVLTENGAVPFCVRWPDGGGAVITADPSNQEEWNAELIDRYRYDQWGDVLPEDDADEQQAIHDAMPQKMSESKAATEDAAGSSTYALSSTEVDSNGGTQ